MKCNSENTMKIANNLLFNDLCFMNYCAINNDNAERYYSITRKDKYGSIKETKKTNLSIA